MAALRHLRDDDFPRPVTPLLRKRRRPAWMDDFDGGVDAAIREESWREHVDWQREHDQEKAMYGDTDWDQRIGWTKDVA